MHKIIICLIRLFGKLSLISFLKNIEAANDNHHKFDFWKVRLEELLAQIVLLFLAIKITR